MTESDMGRIFVSLCGGFFLCLFIYLIRKNILFLKTAARAVGMVKDIVETDSRKIMYTPVIEFKTPSGKKITFSPDSRASSSSYRIGQEVTVLYDPEFPEDAKIRSFVQLWMVSIVLFLVAGLLILVGVLPPGGQAAETVDSVVPKVNEVSPPPDPISYFLLYIFLPGSFIAFGSILLIVGMTTAIKMIASLRWPTAKGLILESEVGSSGKYYFPRIKYEFQVGKQKYTSSHLDLSKGQSGDPLPSKRAVKRYHKGKKAAVYYNPGKPEDCVLEPGIKPAVLLFFFAGGAAFLIFAWMVMVALSNGWIHD